ncbi:MAG: hypothetical protein M1814_006485 [Vezdaea aestivalis]|nr:MAG: hypothetical protein M1814_006485 [Vezdaea aestivalis]
MFKSSRSLTDLHNPFGQFQRSPAVAQTASEMPSQFETSSSPSPRSSSSSGDGLQIPSVEQWNPKTHGSRSKWRQIWPAATRGPISRRQLATYIVLALIIIVWIVPLPATWGPHKFRLAVPSSLHAAHSPKKPRNVPNPSKWLKERSDDQDALSSSWMFSRLSQRHRSRPKAALISLVRNSELPGLVQSMTELEYHWNHKYQYPWIFFNDEPFSDMFKAATQNLTSADCFYEVVPKEHWSVPEWIDEGRFMNSLEYLGAIGVGKGWMISYRHMCRWNSGFFYKHPRLLEYDWYWRVEPDVRSYQLRFAVTTNSNHQVHFFCDIKYDVFRFMQENNIKYGFNMNILDDARSFPSLWSRTRSFMSSHPELIHPDANLDWLLDPHNSGDYNNCQFFSNFEVGSLNFFREEANEKYFNWLDRGGGFFYERFGDAPIHTLSVAMFVPKEEIWFFRDIGYQHDINRQCPPDSQGLCMCEPTSIDENFYKLVPLESPQKKPDDTCIRQFLGGDWLKKKEGWSQEVEQAFGGDGYNGYELSGL